MTPVCSSITHSCLLCDYSICSSLTHSCLLCHSSTYSSLTHSCLLCDSSICSSLPHSGLSCDSDRYLQLRLDPTKQPKMAVEKSAWFDDLKHGTMFQRLQTFGQCLRFLIQLLALELMVRGLDIRTVSPVPDSTVGLRAHGKGFRHSASVSG